jgi:Pyrimidine dimer DNA glycosylase
MRLWTLHPCHLDARGLVGLWREALLAKAVLSGRTEGYRAHPQLSRFRSRRDPVASINAYLGVLLDEARRRGYRFDARRIRGRVAQRPMRVTADQVAFEWEHLLAKLRRRSPETYRALAARRSPRLHPLFVRVPGPVEPWERGARRRPRGRRTSR